MLMHSYFVGTSRNKEMGMGLYTLTGIDDNWDSTEKQTFCPQPCPASLGVYASTTRQQCPAMPPGEIIIMRRLIMNARLQVPIDSGRCRGGESGRGGVLITHVHAPKCH